MMRSILKKLSLIVVAVFALGIQHVKADSVVYFFVDFRFWNSEYTFNVNGKEAFKLVAEPSQKAGDSYLYKMVARKVTFKNEGTFVITSDCPSPKGNYHAELNLNLEDGETHYVLINATLKKTFFMEDLDEKEGLKMLKKIEGNKKYTINEDYVYEGK